MTTEEFSNQFTTLINTYAKFPAFGEEASKGEIYLDEYEKSVFLTMAQDNLVLGLYNGKVIGESFEETEELRRYLDTLVITKEYIDTDQEKDENLIKTNDHSIFFKLPDDVAFITMEQLIYRNTKCDEDVRIKVMPITQDEYGMIKDNPFRCSSKYKALRLDYGTNSRIVEIITCYDIKKYIIKYIKLPNPIILVNLPEDLTIKNKKERTECELNEVLHDIILKEAVKLALASKSIGMTSEKAQ